MAANERLPWDVPENDPLRNLAAMTSQRMGGSHLGVIREERGKLRPQGVKARYWQGGHGILR